jgi:hypothetical protein
MAKFYGVNHGATRDVDLNAFVEQGSDKGKENNTNSHSNIQRIRP